MFDIYIVCASCKDDNLLNLTFLLYLYMLNMWQISRNHKNMQATLSEDNP